MSAPTDAPGRELHLAAPYDPMATLRPLSSGFGDPTIRQVGRRLLLATRAAGAPATLELEPVAADRLVARAFGPGAPALLEAAPALLGLDRPPPAPATLPPEIRSLARRARGLRLPRLPGLLEPLVLLILQQKVAGKEAARAFRNLVHAVSEPAPGPAERVAGLWLPPSREALLRLPGFGLAPLGIPPRQGETLRRVAFSAGAIEALRGRPADELARRLGSLPGVGPWTIGSLLLRACGEGDTVPTGDYNLPARVAFALTGEAQADDARMLDLLAPYQGYRGWLVRWIDAAGAPPPRRHPRRPLRPLPEGRDAALRALRRGPSSRA